MSPAEAVVQRQFEAYNHRDVAGWLATYAEDAEQHALHGALLARGHAEMQPRIATRFAEPALHASLLQRIVMGDWVIDHERICRNFAAGTGTVEMLCVYQVQHGLIRRASFATSTPVMDSIP